MSLRDYPIQEALLNQLLGEPVPHPSSYSARRDDIAAWGKRPRSPLTRETIMENFRRYIAEQLVGD